MCFRCWSVVIRICTWIYHCYSYWNFILRAIWVGYHYYGWFIACCSCIYWILISEGCATWKATWIINWLFWIWCCSLVHCLSFRCWSVVIRICAWIYHCNSHWNFILRAIWVGYHYYGWFIACCSCIYWILISEGCATWKATWIINWLFWIWCCSLVHCLSFRCWSVVIRICAWIYHCNSHWNFILRAIWVGYHYYGWFIACCSCIYWILISEGCATWKATWIINWLFWIWCCSLVHCLSFRCWSVVIRIFIWNGCKWIKCQSWMEIICVFTFKKDRGSIDSCFCKIRWHSKRYWASSSICCRRYSCCCSNRLTILEPTDLVFTWRHQSTSGTFSSISWFSKVIRVVIHQDVVHWLWCD